MVTIINHPNFDSLYHPFMVVLGMVLLLFYHLVMSNIAIEHCHRNSEFPVKNGDFP